MRTEDPLRLRSGQALVPLVKTRDFGMTPGGAIAEDFQIEPLPSGKMRIARGQQADRSVRPTRALAVVQFGLRVGPVKREILRYA